MTDFSSWLENQYIDWQKSAGSRKTINEFADFLGVSQPLVSMWMNGKRRPGAENIDALAEVLGDEIYDLLNIPRPDPDLLSIKKLWAKLPETARHALAEQAARYTTHEPDTQPKPAQKTN